MKNFIEVLKDSEKIFININSIATIKPCVGFTLLHLLNGDTIKVNKDYVGVMDLIKGAN